MYSALKGLVNVWSLRFSENTSPLISAFSSALTCVTCYRLTGVSLETYLGHFYFLWFFLFSLHSVTDQIGAAPVTCQRNVPALSSITSSTRTGRAVVRCRPQTTPGAAAPYLVDWLGCARVFGVLVQIQHAGLDSRMLTRHRRGSGSIT